MPKYPIKNEKGETIELIEAPSFEEAVEAYKADQGFEPDNDAFPEPPSRKEMISQPTTLQEMGFGPTPEMAKQMEGLSTKEKLDLIANAIGGKVASGATLGIAPAFASYMTEGKSDEGLERGTDVLGSSLSTGLEIASGFNPVTAAAAPFSRAVGATKFAPGAIKAAGRVGAGAVDDALIQSLNMSLRGEDVSPTALIDIAKTSGTWGGALEALLGLKRKIGRSYAHKDMTPQEIALDQAIADVDGLLKGKKVLPGQETVLDVLGDTGVSTAQSLKNVAPDEFAKMQDWATSRMQQGPLRLRTGAEGIAGTPLQSSKAEAQAHKDEAYSYNPDYLPQFERQPTMRGARLQLDLGAISPRTGQSIKTGVTVPKGFENALDRPQAYKAFDKARKEAQEYADSLSVRDRGGKAPPPTEVLWYTIRGLEAGSEAEKVLGQTLRGRLKTQFPDLKDIIEAQATEHGISRAAEEGGRMWTQPYRYDTQEGRAARSTPGNREAFERGFLGDMVTRAEEGKPLPLPSVATATTARTVLGNPRGDQLNELLRVERAKRDVDVPIAKTKAPATGVEAKKPKSALSRAAGGIARVGIGAALGGLPGAVWGVPSLIRALNANPNQFMSPDKGGAILQALRENLNNRTQARAPNRFERSGNVDGIVPTMNVGVEREREERRKTKRRKLKESEEFLKED